jgi:DNA polymerase-1
VEVSKFVAVDTEGDMLGFSVAIPGFAMYIPVAHLQEDVNLDPTEAIKVIDSVPCRIFHNAAHDLQIFENYGTPLNGPFIDTMIIAHMVDENIPSKQLDYLHKHYCKGEGKNRHPMMEGIIKAMGWEYVPIELMCEYATNDAVITLELFMTLRPLYEKQFGAFFSGT